MKILYIYRHPDMGFSIGKVFRPIEENMKRYAEVDSCYLPVANYSITGLIKNILYARKCSNQKKYDIIHITGSEHYLIPFIKLNKSKIIVTVHDLGSIYLKKPILAFLKRLLFIQTLRFADIITCISSKTCDEVLKHIPFLKGKIIIVHNPVGDELYYRHKSFNYDNPTILHIGTQPHKNLVNSIKALRNIKCILRVIGDLTPHEKKILDEYNITYSNSSNLSDLEIVEEYYNCDIVSFPSLYEGFGMPIIEGQSIGRVIVTSNISPMKEIANKSAVLVDPYDYNSIENGYKEAIKNNTEYIQKGLINIKRFSLGIIVNDYFSIYQNIVK